MLSNNQHQVTNLSTSIATLIEGNSFSLENYLSSVVQDRKTTLPEQITYQPLGDSDFSLNLKDGQLVFSQVQGMNIILEWGPWINILLRSKTPTKVAA